LDFRHGLVATLEDIYASQKVLDRIENAPLHEMYSTALHLESLVTKLSRLNVSRSIGPFDLIRTRSIELRRRLEKDIQDYWSNVLVQVDTEEGNITVASDQGQFLNLACPVANLCRFLGP
jgi:hypothetical protein